MCVLQKTAYYVQQTPSKPRYSERCRYFLLPRTQYEQTQGSAPKDRLLVAQGCHSPAFPRHGPCPGPAEDPMQRYEFRLHDSRTLSIAVLASTLPPDSRPPLETADTRIGGSGLGDWSRLYGSTSWAPSALPPPPPGASRIGQRHSARRASIITNGAFDGVIRVQSILVAVKDSSLPLAIALGCRRVCDHL